MSREVPWPQATYVKLSQPSATLADAFIEYSEIVAGRGPMVATGRLRVGRASSRGMRQVYVVFAVDHAGKGSEQAAAT